MMKVGQCITGLQMGTSKCASQSGIIAYGTSRHLLYDTKNHILPLMNYSTISLKIGTNKYASQVGTTTPRTQQHTCDTKLGANKCDNSISPQMRYMQDTNLDDQVFDLN